MIVTDKEDYPSEQMEHPKQKKLLLITGRKLTKQRKTAKSSFNPWYSANCSYKSVIYLLRVLITRFIAVLHS